MTSKVDIAIIGAGVIGLAIAYELSKKNNLSIAVLEKNKKYGQETSSRNSEVIHAGIYHPEHMLKTKLCIEGRKLLYSFCEKHQLRYKKLGKLIIAVNEHEEEQLFKLYNNGKNNGLKLDYINEKKILSIEPLIKAKSAIYSPESGVIDSHELLQRLFYLCKEQGVIFSFTQKVIGLQKVGSKYFIETEQEEIATDILINAAGLHSSEISGLLGLKEPKLYYCKGEYFRLRKKIPIKHLIYPLPKKGVLGIHLTIDMDDGIRLGPNAHYIENINYEVKEETKGEFYEAVKTYLPFLKADDLLVDFAGIRPRLQGPKDTIQDFWIKEESERELPGFINLIGIESPGLTSCLALARYLSDMI